MPARKRKTPTKPPVKRMKKEDKRGLRKIEAKFLAAYRVCGSLTKAAEIARCSRMTHYAWLRDRPNYPAEFAAAHEEAVERLEIEARRRAVEGVVRIKFHMGEPLTWINPKTKKEEYYVEHEYSDALLIALLKANLPGKYRENRTVEHRGNAGQQTVVVNVEPQAPPFADAPAELIEQLIDYLANRQPGDRPPPQLVESVPVPPEPDA